MSDAVGIVVLIGRILFAVHFLVAATGHLTQGGMMVGYARSKGFPLAFGAGWPAGVWLLAGALSVLLGVWPELGALLIALFVVVTALGIHQFWTIQDPAQRQAEMLNFTRNVTFLGAAIALFGFFAAAGGDLKFALLKPLIHF